MNEPVIIDHDVMVLIVTESTKMNLRTQPMSHEQDEKKVKKSLTRPLLYKAKQKNN